MTNFHVLANWSHFFSVLSSVVELDRLAEEKGALLRRRQVRTAEDLLRLALAYATGQSLRTTAGWAALAGIATLSDVALLKRLRRAADWLVAVAGRLVLALAGAEAASGRRRIRLIDATCLSKPGSTGTDWRLHAVFDPIRQCFADFELTDAHGGESLERFTVTPGEIWLGDRGYIARAGLRHVVSHGADFLIRMGWNAFSLQTVDGDRFDLFAALRKSQDYGQWTVRLAGDQGPLQVRLIAVRKSPEATEADGRRIRQDAKRRGKTPDARSLEAAEWILLVTSLPQDQLPITEAAALYRLRWQVELGFKRLKSLGHFDQLPANDPNLARAWIAAKLIIAIVTEQVTEGVLDSPPCARENPDALAFGLAPP